MLLKSHRLLLLQLLIASIHVTSCFGTYYQNLDHFHRPTVLYRPPWYFRDQQNYNYYYNRRPNYAHRRSYNNEFQASDPVTRPKVVNVNDYGAKADGGDDSQAFKKAWEEACSYGGDVLMVVPKNRVYVVKPVTFSGPCRSNKLAFKIYGTIKATDNPSDYSEDTKYWLRFSNVENLRVYGGGIIDGSGKIWWQNSCKVNQELPCKDAPTAMTFSDCSNLLVSSLWFQNAQQMHLVFDKCFNVKALNLQVTAPGDSPNTDGIHVTKTKNIKIQNSVIRTGDDCISIVSGSKNVRAIGITCGPGHGISIGSLGAGNEPAYVSNVLVDKVRLSGTTNGLRIKTWQGGSGYAKNIIFQNVLMHNVTNPIIINQNYCDQDEPCAQQYSAVEISNVMYTNIRGSSASEDAITFNCSKSFPCQRIWLQSIALARQELNQDDDQVAKASCSNVGIISRGSVSPRCSTK
ncbi:hypothetical protein SLA2020_349410 [Shorea laevis]